jgi:hypothetical protein
VKREVLVLLEVPFLAPVSDSGAQGVLVRWIVVMHEVIVLNIISSNYLGTTNIVSKWLADRPIKYSVHPITNRYLMFLHIQ